MGSMDTRPINSRPQCKYGNKCYQKNPIHLSKYSHPQNENNNDGFSDKNVKKRKLYDSLDNDIKVRNSYMFDLPFYNNRNFIELLSK